MVKIENIVLKDDLVYADCYQDGDKLQKKSIVVNVKTGKLVSPIVNSYTYHAARRIKELYSRDSELPRSACAKWY